MTSLFFKMIHFGMAQKLKNYIGNYNQACKKICHNTIKNNTSFHNIILEKIFLIDENIILTKVKILSLWP